MNPDFIGAYSLDPGQDLTVTISHVVREQVTGNGGKKEECTVAYLQGQKPFILNATNSKSIAKLYGPFIEDWAGRQITLFATTTKLAGEQVECLRIRPKVAARKKEQLSPERFKQAVGAVLSGRFSADKLRSDYELTQEQQDALNAQVQTT
ncbi:hypothetical protein CCO03_08510 [Comamonas serinivorans]|uniref:Uncharacterized protein n=2 Tax=Comamonas serinivorans TaxID=1082851 RepID=A0A1Y0EMQ4_9BURK|nr:hypothetical protein CCO03_08510 [Comamonas serinivorans]